MTKEIRQDGRSHLSMERDAKKNNRTEGPQASDYLADIAELDFDEAQALELLSVLFSIMKSCVEMGFKVDVCAYVFRDYLEASRGESAIGYPSFGFDNTEARKE